MVEFFVETINESVVHCNVSHLFIASSDFLYLLILFSIINIIGTCQDKDSKPTNIHVKEWKD